MNKIKKVWSAISAVLVTTLSFSAVIVPTKVIAFSGGGNGSLTYPYRIDSCIKLQEMENDSTAYYALMADLDCSSASWRPVNLNGGGFDGRNHTVSGINVSTSHSNNVGFFSALSNTTVQNLNLTSITISDTTSPDSNIGGLAGSTASSATVTNVNVQGSVTGYQVVGGLIGQINPGSNVSKSSFTGDVTAQATDAGGFAGRIFSSNVSDSFANATVNGSGFSGGFTADFASDENANFSITRSYFVGDVSDANNPVLFSNRLDRRAAGTLTISNSFAVGTGTRRSDSSHAVSPFGQVDTDPVTVSGFYFDQTAAGTTDCGAGQTCSTVNGDGTDGNHYKNTSAPAPMSGNWDFDNVWQTGVGAYPTLMPASVTLLVDFTAPDAPTNLAASTINAHTTEFTWDAPGNNGGASITNYILQWRPTTIDDSGSWTMVPIDSNDTSVQVNDLPVGDIDFKVAAINSIGQGAYTSIAHFTVPEPPSPNIASCEDLQAIALDPTANYVLTQDIDCSETTTWNDNGDGGYYGFLPITYFSGSLDGQGHTISGLYMNRPTDGDVAPFYSLIDGGSISNVTFDNVDISGYYECAGVVALMTQTSTIDNVHVTGNINSSYTSGGIVAYVDVETDADHPQTIAITDSTANMSFDSYYDDNAVDWGGIIGSVYLQNGSLNLSTSDGTIYPSNENSQYLGGLIGYAEIYDNGHITIDSSTGNSGPGISCATDCGGLIGYFYGYWYQNGTKPQLAIVDSAAHVALDGHSNVGGIIGHVDVAGTDINITRSKFEGGLFTTGDNVGGLIGTTQNEDTDLASSINISQSYADADIESSVSNPNEIYNLGGLIAYTNLPTTITNSYFKGTAVSWGITAGGLVGMSEAPLTITNAYVTADFVGAFFGPAGGLVGSLQDATINNSFAAALVGTAESPDFGAVIGDVLGTLDSSSTMYYDRDLTNSLDHCYGNQGDGDIEATCVAVNIDGENPDYFLGNHINTPLDSWDFDNVWIVKHNHYPQLLWTVPPPANPNISDCEHLQDITNHTSENFVLTQNIDCTVSSSWNEGAGFTPIGSDEDPFTGTLDGAGHTIVGLHIDLPHNDGVGLFSSLDGASIHDLKLTGDIHGQSNVGALAGNAINGTTISNVASRAAITGEDSQVGGLVGTIANSAISGSASSGDVSGYDNVGGLAGKLISADVDHSHASGTVVASNDNAGGLVGYNSGSTIDTSFATGSATAGDIRAGGLEGLDENGVVTDSYARGDATSASYYVGGLIGASNHSAFSRTYATGNATGTLSVGGLVGYNINNTAIEDSFSTGIATTADGGTDADTNSLVGIDNGAVISYSNDWFNSDNGKPCAVDDNEDPINTEACAGVSLTDNPTVFMSATDQPIVNWDIDTVWRINSADYPCLRNNSGVCSDDTDSDGVSNAVEGAAPNNGDGNGDGIADDLQANVTSFIDPVTGHYATLVASSDCSNLDVSAAPETDNSVLDSGFNYPVGLMHFSLDCGLPGFSATVTEYFYGNYSASSFIARKYNPTTHSYTTLPGATLQNVTIGGQAALKVTYQVADGSAYDEDGASNGIVVDPSGPGALVISAPNTGFGGGAE